MKKYFFICIALLYSTMSFGQKYKTDQGHLNNISGIDQYEIMFKYSEDLKIPNYNSEREFVEFQFKKREAKETGSGEKFRNAWFQNRKNKYEPTFIEEFNAFRLKNRQVTVSKNHSEAQYVMAIEILLIYPGYNVTVWEEEAKLEASIKIYKKDFPETILFSTETIQIHGKPGGDEFEKVRTAYGELGRWTSKFFCRKT